MMSKKFIPVIIALTAASIFIAFKSEGRVNDEDNPKLRYAKILRNVGVLLEEGHFNPKPIDDKFSTQVLEAYIKELDNDKKVFLASDIESFKRYENRIDDELRGAPLESFYAINELYTKRQAEIADIYKGLLAKPFDFTSNETLTLDEEKTVFSKDAAARFNTWRKYIKYLVLDRYVTALTDRDKAKDKKDAKPKADSTLEREARESIYKLMDRSAKTSKTRETEDFNFGKFVNTIASTMDPHTNYLPPIDLRTFNEGMRGSFYGIGAVLKEEDGKIKIASMVVGMPAFKTGELKENDEVIKVAQGEGEPVDVTGYSVQDAVKLIRGETKGSVVKLTVRKVDGSEKVIAIKRDDIKLNETFAKSVIIKGEHRIGYIRLPEFYADFDKPNGARSAVDVAKEIEKLKDENIDGLMLDLRGNGGGSLADVVQIAGLFIEDGPICQVKGRGDRPQVLRDRDKNVLYSGPLTVLVDETSASASEIFAAAIQDYNRGIIIGSTSTYGKGTVQRNIPLNPESSNSLFANKEVEDLGTVKLTLQKFYRINGDATQNKGVVPDIILPDRLEFLKIREKDNVNALKYDQIPKADYKTWSSSASSNPIVTQANQAVKSSNTFSKIREQARWIEQNTNKAYQLNIKNYKAEKDSMAALYKKVENLYKLPKPLLVANLMTDTAFINKTKENKESNTAFVKAISEDIYIDESVKVLYKMITQGAMARVE